MVKNDEIKITDGGRGEIERKRSAVLHHYLTLYN
jgi:hypothetical protein